MSRMLSDYRMYYGTTPREQEIDLDLDSDDEAVEAYIEAGRLEFYEEWFRYISED